MPIPVQYSLCSTCLTSVVKPPAYKDFDLLPTKTVRNTGNRCVVCSLFADVDVHAVAFRKGEPQTAPAPAVFTDEQVATICSAIVAAGKGHLMPHGTPTSPIGWLRVLQEVSGR